MTDWTQYWESWAPYWHFLENNMLDLESAEEIAPLLESPVLVIGAGQGLIVEQLRQKGVHADGVELSRSMVELAKERRGIDLIEADARELPFADGSYRTSIVATGVVDFLEDEAQIALILNEVRRVTDGSGSVLVAFYRFHPRVEHLLRIMGPLKDDGHLCWRRMYELCWLSPLQCLVAVKKETNIGLVRAFLTVARAQMFMPRKERKAAKNLTKLRQQAEDPEALIQVTPPLTPYRVDGQITDLFGRLNIPVREVFPYHSCTIVRL